MRPKTVFLIMTAAVGLLAALVVAKMLVSTDENVPTGDPNPPPVVVQATAAPPVVVTSNLSYTNVLAKTPEQEREERLEKELDELREDYANGRAAALLPKLGSKEPEVRKEAIEALKMLDYAEAIPHLKDVMNQTEDIREKMTIMEAIESLQATSSVQVAEGSLDAHTNFSTLSKKLIEQGTSNKRNVNTNRTKRSAAPK